MNRKTTDKSMGAHRNFFRVVQGTDDMASAGARVYNGGLGAEPPAESRGRAVSGRSSGEVEHFEAFKKSKKLLSCPYAKTVQIWYQQ